MSAYIFLGPTLPVKTAGNYLDAVYCPPAAQGDILRILPHRPRLIGIIDGYFETVPAVWHKEILYAMSQGVHVFGASSMGALRAAELDVFGMVGIGRIYEWYRYGVLEDDDEVAIAHGPADCAYLSVSEAMVNIRHAVEMARQRGLMSEVLASRLLATAKALHYSKRSYRGALELLREKIDPQSFDELLHFLVHCPKLKTLDAIELLQEAAAFLATDPPPRTVSYSLENTAFLDEMISEAARCAAEGAAAASEVDRSLMRHEILMRILARREATRLGFDSTGDEVSEAIATYAKAFGIDSIQSLQQALERCGIPEESFNAMMRDAVLLEKLDRYYDRDIRGAAAEHIRIRNFRRVRSV